jgi:hypothetical protein
MVLKMLIAQERVGAYLVCVCWWWWWKVKQVITTQGITEYWWGGVVRNGPSDQSGNWMEFGRVGQGFLKKVALELSF